jgi:hypothetical protein
LGLVRPLLLLVLQVVGLSVAARASAASVRWSAPDDCPENEFVFTLEQTLERSIDEMVDVDISLEVEGAGNAWRVEFSLGPNPGRAPATRTLQGTSCGDVSRAAAVAVAMALHARGRVEEEPSSEPPTPEPPEPEHKADAAPQGARESSPGTPWSVPISAGIVLDGALLGELALGYSFGLGIGWRGWELGTAVAVLPQTRHATSDGLALNLDALLGIAVLCRRVGGPPANPRLCIGYEFGSVRGEGAGPGLRATYSRRATWEAVRADLGVDLSLSEDFTLLFAGGLVVALTQARFVFDDGPVAHRLPRFSGRGSAAVRWVF